MSDSMMRDLIRGAAAGAAASIPQAAVGKLQDMLILPPGEDANIAPRLMDRLAHADGRDPSPAQEWLLGTGFHVAYGAGWGVLYALIARRLRPAPLLGGIALGATIYGVTFPRWGIAVLTGTERPAGQRSRRMTAVAWSVALAFGISTASFFRLAVDVPGLSDEQGEDWRSQRKGRRRLARNMAFRARMGR